MDGAPSWQAAAAEQGAHVVAGVNITIPWSSMRWPSVSSAPPSQSKSMKWQNARRAQQGPQSSNGASTWSWHRWTKLDTPASASWFGEPDAAKNLRMPQRRPCKLDNKDASSWHGRTQRQYSRRLSCQPMPGAARPSRLGSSSGPTRSYEPLGLRSASCAASRSSARSTSTASRPTSARCWRPSEAESSGTWAAHHTGTSRATAPPFSRAARTACGATPDATSSSATPPSSQQS